MAKLVAAGDSILIDDYTEVDGGGAANQFADLIQQEEFSNLAFDGCRIDDIESSDVVGDVIVISMGGNDLLTDFDMILGDPDRYLPDFRRRYSSKLGSIRESNPESLILVVNIYEPAKPLAPFERDVLFQVNSIISDLADVYGAELVDIHSAFEGNQEEWLIDNIEPNYEGATEIAECLHEAFLNNRHGENA